MPLSFRSRPADFRSLVIESDRVRLHAIAKDYTAEINRNFTPEITRYMMPAPPTDISETRAFVTSALQGLDRGDDLHFVICRRDNAEFIGVCGLHGQGPPAAPELGIWLKKAAHGNRYGREAIRALSEWAGEHLDFERLVYPVDRRNVPSRKIAESLGGTVIAEKKVLSFGGLELDEVVYGIPRPAINTGGHSDGSHSTAYHSHRPGLLSHIDSR